MSFSESSFTKKLTELNNTQQSIQTLSLWLIHHRKHSKTIVQVWLRELQKAKPAKRLTFMYLANDVIQNSKKKGPEFTKDFGSVLMEGFLASVKDADDKMKGAVDRILNIWEERGVYSKDFIKQIKQGRVSTPVSEPPVKKRKKKEEEGKQLSLLEELESNFAPDYSKAVDRLQGSLQCSNTYIVNKIQHDGHSSGKILLTSGQKLQKSQNPELQAEDLVKKLAELENSASSDAAVREKIAALPPEVSDINSVLKVHDKEDAEKLSAKVDDACMLLTNYNNRLTEELEERKRVAKMLRQFIVSQREQLQNSEKKLMEYQAKLAKVATVRQELKSHIQNLPDLTLLPDVTEGLKPLPSAMDLFH
ncbi:hypothetical protein CHS0354_042886 [Potamilus streckersoni]|uniref:CID domain-containing protein n=1 Tax=Potamilus streckersoni TaxID=2493646 RepID=A0AAE0T5X8_9BIVA|nr:hypothetical protein CHS0354_042886 [Potamilus streckersoni]